MYKIYGLDYVISNNSDKVYYSWVRAMSEEEACDVLRQSLRMVGIYEIDITHISELKVLNMDGDCND